MARNWREVRAEADLNQDEVAAHELRMLAEIRAERLAEVRRRHELSQTEVADSMGVSQARVSAIEKGEIAVLEVGTLAKYVTALGGTLRVVADFGDEKLVIG